MNELRRMAYLEALGIDSYVSRQQLPGAAPTRRLAIVPAAAPIPPRKSLRESIRGTAAEASRMPARGHGPAASSDQSARPGQHQQQTANSPAPRFSLVALVAGEFLWLEALVGMPLATEQVQLVAAMARALGQPVAPGSSSPLAPRPLVSQFDWPIHSNAQLDQGVEAARSGVAGFVGRKVEEHGCRGIVLLGQSCAQWIVPAQLGVPCIGTHSSAEIVADATLKRQVWRDLLPLRPA